VDAGESNTSGSEAAKLFKKMLDKGFTEKDAVESLAQVGLKYKPPKEKQVNNIISAQEQIEKIRAEIRMQKNLMKQQQARHNNLMTQLDEAEEKIFAYEAGIEEKEQRIAELELKCAHELGPSKVMLQTVSAVPHSQEEDIQIVNDMNERIAANFTNQDDANFVMSGLMQLLSSTHSIVASQADRMTQLEQENIDLQNTNTTLQAQLCPVPADSSSIVPVTSPRPKTRLTPAPKAAKQSPMPATDTEASVARSIISKGKGNLSSASISAGAGEPLAPAEAYPPEMLGDEENPFGLSCDIDQDDTDAKKPGATLASNANLPVSQLCKARRNRQSTKSVVALHNMYGTLEEESTGEVDADI